MHLRQGQKLMSQKNFGILKTKIILFLFYFVLTTNMSCIGFSQKEKSLSGHRKEIEEKYEKAIKEYEEFSAKLETKKKNSKATYYASFFEEDENKLEKMATSIAKIENDCTALIAGLENMAKEGTIDGFEACIELASIYINAIKKKTHTNFEIRQFFYECKKYVDNILESKNKPLPIFIAKAHKKYARLLIEAFKTIKQRNLNTLLDITSHYEAAKQIFEDIINRKSINLNGQLPIENSKLHIYETDMLYALLDAHKYRIKYIEKNKEISKEEFEENKKIAKGYLQKIISYIGEKNIEESKKSELKISICMRFCHIMAMVKLGVFIAKFEYQESQEKIPLRSCMKVLFALARNLALEHRDKLRKFYYGDCITEIIQICEVNIKELETKDTSKIKIVDKKHF